jgi:hypothetical protein
MLCGCQSVKECLVLVVKLSSVSFAANSLKVSRSTVVRRLSARRGAATRENSLARRPPVVSAVALAAIAKRRAPVKKLACQIESKKVQRGGPRSQTVIIKYRPFSSAKMIQCELFRQHGTEVGASTIRRDLKACDFHCFVRKKGPLRVVGDSVTRLKFANFCLLCPTFCKSLLFSDEKLADGNYQARTEFAQCVTEATRRSYDQGSPRVMFWGCIGVGYKRLIYLPNLLSGATYIKEVLAPMAVEFKNKAFSARILQEDNAKAHVCNLARHYKTKHNIRTMESVSGGNVAWPPRSPDISPIESLWAILSYRVYCKHHPMTHEEIKAAWLAEWDALTQDEVDKLVLTFTGRLQKLVSLKGETI